MLLIDLQYVSRNLLELLKGKVLSFSHLVRLVGHLDDFMR
jgi:hypothetical protein